MNNVSGIVVKSLLIVFSNIDIFCKDSANREKNEMNPFISSSEVPPVLFKDSANREKNEMNPFISSSEVPPVLFKDSANREKNEMNFSIFIPLSFVANYVSISSL